VCGQQGQRAGRAWVVSEAECNGGRDDEGAGDEGSVSRDAEWYDDEMGQLETKDVTALLPAAAAHRHPRFTLHIATLVTWLNDEVHKLTKQNKWNKVCQKQAQHHVHVSKNKRTVCQSIKSPSRLQSQNYSNCGCKNFNYSLE
jgi:hypothetical protein